MILYALIFIPVIAAAAAYLSRSDRFAIRILPVTAMIHLALSLVCLYFGTYDFKLLADTKQWIGLDMLGSVFLILTSVLFLMLMTHCTMKLSAEKNLHDEAHQGGQRMSDRAFAACMMLFLATMTLVICSRNFGLLWVAVEATTLASAPLICFHRSGRSLEAMWKYILICSLGIGLALLGTMILSVSGLFALQHGMSLNFDVVARHSNELHTGWFKAAFIFILIGYGAKMGLAPMHTWLPDAHSEAPPTVSALLSGCLLNCAFLGIIRFVNIAPDSLVPFCHTLLIAAGVLSLAVAAFFIIGQTDYKRMLAYSSVEHMGIAAILWGLGAGNAALIHLIGHSFIKCFLFITAGNILLAYGTRQISMVHSMMGTLPKNAALWLFGLVAICAFPPSPLFVTEFILIRDSITAGHYILAATVIILLFIVFAGMSQAFIRMCTSPGANENAPEVMHEANMRGAEKLWIIPLLLLLTAGAFGTQMIYLLNIGGIL